MGRHRSSTLCKQWNHLYASRCLPQARRPLAHACPNSAVRRRTDNRRIPLFESRRPEAHHRVYPWQSCSPRCCHSRSGNWGSWRMRRRSLSGMALIRARGVAAVLLAAVMGPTRRWLPTGEAHRVARHSGRDPTGMTGATMTVAECSVRPGSRIQQTRRNDHMDRPRCSLPCRRWHSSRRHRGSLRNCSADRSTHLLGCPRVYGSNPGRVRGRSDAARPPLRRPAQDTTWSEAACPAQPTGEL